MNIEDLPEEMIVAIMEFLDGKSLYTCSRTSTFLRKCSKRESLWRNIKLKQELHHMTPKYEYFYYPIPIDFIKFVIENGCKFLNLSIFRNQRKKEYSCLPLENNVSYLRLRHPQYQTEFHEKDQDIFSELILRCCKLEKLAMKGISILNFSISGIRKHSKTLTILDLTDCIEVVSQHFREIIIQCEELIERGLWTGVSALKNSILGTHL